LSPTSQRADVVLPCTLWGEKAGTIANIEGRVQRVNRKVAPEGTAMDDWRIALELMARLGHDVDLATVDEVTDTIARVAPAFAGVTAALTRRARDGVVLPLREHREELVLRARDLSIKADDGSGTSWDPIKVEGVVPADSTNAVEGSGAGFEPLKPGAGDPQDDPEQAARVVAESTAAADESREAAEVPDLHAWAPHAPSTQSPARDAYALRLVAGRSLYDNGRIVRETPVLAQLRPDPLLRIHPSDAARLGVEQGGEVRITSARASEVISVASDPNVPAGIARYDWTADGKGPSQHIDAGAPVTDLRVESVR
jgi:anaerobic selenocysteine-containing dehydrogenase